MQTAKKNPGPYQLGLILLLGFLWGIPFALTKISLTTIPPLTAVAGRVAIAAVALWLIVLVLRHPIPRQWTFARDVMAQSLIACVIPYAFIAFGQRHVDSALAAILNSTTPLFVCILSVTWARREPVTTARLAGVIIGLGGVLMIVGIGTLTGLGQQGAGQVAVLVATISSAFSALYGRRFSHVAPEITAAAVLTSAALILLPLCSIVEAPWHAHPSVLSIAALSANAIVATALGFVVYFRLINTVGSIGTASAGYLKPAVGVLLGCILLGESMIWVTLAGLFVIVLGVAVTNVAIPFAPMYEALRRGGMRLLAKRPSVPNCQAQKITQP